ncbi:MAG: hypothetical protein ACRCUZ_17710, partial [Shewanella sp.]
EFVFIQKSTHSVITLSKMGEEKGISRGAAFNRCFFSSNGVTVILRESMKITIILRELMKITVILRERSDVAGSMPSAQCLASVRACLVVLSSLLR